MSKTSPGIRKYLGYKLFKETDEDQFEIIRIIKIMEFNDKVIIRNEETENVKEVPFKGLTDYTPLSPVGIVGFSHVKMNMAGEEQNDDIIVTLYRQLDIELTSVKLPPYGVCRQGINDFFYSIISKDENHNMVGVSVTRDDCPGNIPYDALFACDDVLTYDMVSVYRDDTLESILRCIKLDTYDSIMAGMFQKHCDSLGPKGKKILETRTEHNGWCNTLKQLLQLNNFETDFNSMCNITGVDFDMTEHLIEIEDHTILDPECKAFFEETFHVSVADTFVVKYGYDIDLGEFKDNSYNLLKDNKNDIYVIVYTSDGEYLEKDLEKRELQMDVSDRLRVSYYNKYANEQTEE